MFENVLSRRKGYTPAPVQGKLEEISDHTRNRLWDIFYICIYRANLFNDLDGSLAPVRRLRDFFRSVWTEVYRGRIDEYPGSEHFLVMLKADFLGGSWYFPFDIFEEISQNWKDLMGNPNEVASQIRHALERENQAYTFVGGRFVERMTPQEVESVETALQTSIEAIHEHFETALQLLSDRDNPDYRNSIKESISAVEAACQHLTGQKSATLGEALKKLDSQRPLHGALREGLLKLYGWTSDQGGIRHAINDASIVERVDAQFMLVACSAFVNYLLTR
jgi:hypothetical protein